MASFSTRSLRHRSNTVSRSSSRGAVSFFTSSVKFPPESLVKMTLFFLKESGRILNGAVDFLYLFSDVSTRVIFHC